MEYLVQVSVDSNVPVPFEEQLEKMVIPTTESMITARKEGRVKAGGIYLGRRGAAFVVEASSPEEVDEMVRSRPVFAIAKCEVIPLIPFEKALTQQKKLLAERKAGGRVGVGAR